MSSIVKQSLELIAARCLVQFSLLFVLSVFILIEKVEEPTYFSRF